MDETKLKEFILCNYDINAERVSLMTKHFDTKVYLVNSKKGKYVLKTIAMDLGNPKEEGEVTEFLYNKGISTPRLIKTQNNKYEVEHKGCYYYLQEYIDGEVLEINSAPQWFMEKSAKLLGEIHKALGGYQRLPLLFNYVFGDEFFTINEINKARESYKNTFKKALANNDVNVADDITERLRQLDKISMYKFDVDKLTFVNSHGDYYISQIINTDYNLSVIDWIGASYIPASWEIIMSYTYAAKECRSGVIDIVNFKKYLVNYLEVYSLNKYDLLIMSYLYHYQLSVCNFYEPYEDLPSDYLKIAKLTTALMRWLYDYADEVSEELTQISISCEKRKEW